MTDQIHHRRTLRDWFGGMEVVSCLLFTCFKFYNFVNCYLHPFNKSVLLTSVAGRSAIVAVSLRFVFDFVEINVFEYLFVDVFFSPTFEDVDVEIFVIFIDSYMLLLR